MILALEDGTQLHVWPGSLNAVHQLVLREDSGMTDGAIELDGLSTISEVTLSLNRGDIVVCRGDLMHAQ